MKSTPEMRARILELMTDPIDDYDRAVECVLRDLESFLAEVEMRKAISAWLGCPAEKRPTPQALGQRVADIASAHIHEGLTAAENRER